MVNNVSMGAVQIFSLDMASVNLALIQLQERIDELKGLRGRAEIWDRARAEDPRITQDVLTVGSVENAESVVNVAFLAAQSAPVLLMTPGVTYVESSTQLRQRINFNATQPLEARITIAGFGTEAGTGKSVAIVKEDETVIASVTWDGKLEGVYNGEYTAVTFEMDQTVRVYVKASSVTEHLVLQRVNFDMRYNTITI